MVLASQAIDNLWAHHAERVPGSADLLERMRNLGTSLELQVMVSSAGGEPVPDRRNTYTDGDETWFSFRIPKGAANEPHWKDFNLSWDIVAHTQCIGSTGWDWQAKKSVFVGFDYDSIVSHKSGVGLDDETLEEIRDAAFNLPYVEVRNSTSGNGGLHFYVFTGGIPNVQNHQEHAAVARAVLSKISEECGFDFHTHVDACGMVLWHAAQRADEDRGSFACLKHASEVFTGLDPNWREHLDVVTRRRSRVRVPGIVDEEEEQFLNLTSAYTRVELDDTHKEIRAQLEAISDFDTRWVQEHYLLQTHTKAIEQIAGEYRGVFKTSSSGSTRCNCFLYPVAGGVWKVFRFGQGVREDESWEHDEWTWCWFNKSPSFEQAALSIDASRTEQENKFEAGCVEDAERLVRVYTDDSDFTVGEMPRELYYRSCMVQLNKEGSISLVIKRNNDDPRPNGWHSGKRGYWSFVVQTQVEEVDDQTNFDDMVRCVETPEGKPAGWMAKRTHTKSKGWMHKNASSIRNIFQALGLTKPEADQQMGSCELKPWQMVQMPFAEEYPGGRKWNIGAPQFAYEPALEPGPHPSWDMILDHVGASIDSFCMDLTWCASGREYLQAWIAAAMREPFEPLPYLALYGPQNSGKSILHEAIALLVTSGVVKADRALTSKSDFNGELQGCVFAVVEEKDISRAPGALNKIKDVVTAVNLSIRKMRTDSYMVPNTTHWIQCTNEIGGIPVFPGDTRITMLYVSELQFEIPKPRLLKQLRDEAPCFLRTVLDFKLPPFTGRLRIPVIETEDKATALALSQNSLEAFIDEYIERDPEGLIRYQDFYDRFFSQLPPGEHWTKQKVSKKMPAEFKVVRKSNNVAHIQGMAWRKDPNFRYISNVKWKDSPVDSQDNPKDIGDGGK